MFKLYETHVKYIQEEVLEVLGISHSLYILFVRSVVLCVLSPPSPSSISPVKPVSFHGGFFLTYSARKLPFPSVFFFVKREALQQFKRAVVAY